MPTQRSCVRGRVKSNAMIYCVVESEDEEVINDEALGLDVGTKREDNDEELIDEVEEPKEMVANMIDPYHTWFNGRHFSEDQKAEADNIL